MRAVTLEPEHVIEGKTARLIVLTMKTEQPTGRITDQHVCAFAGLAKLISSKYFGRNHARRARAGNFERLRLEQIASTAVQLEQRAGLRMPRGGGRVDQHAETAASAGCQLQVQPR